MDDLGELEEDLRIRAKEETSNVISITLGEYIDEEAPREEWDLRSLSSWAMSRFGVSLPQNQLRKMTPQEIQSVLEQAAMARIDQLDLSPLSRYLEAGFAQRSLADWARNKFGIDVSAQELTGEEMMSDQVRALLIGKVEAAYRRREIEYPVEYAIDMTVGVAGTDNVYAVNALAEWANRKFEARLTGEELRGRKIEDIRQALLAMSREWSGDGKLQEMVHQHLGSAAGVPQAIEFARARFDTELKPSDFDSDVTGPVLAAGRLFLRREMTELERFVLLQIYDTSWIDHLLGMDHLKSGIGLRGFAERDPRVAYKTEGSELFREMIAGVREKVTDMIFKVRLAAGAQMASAYRISNVIHEQLSGYDHLTQQMDQQAAMGPQKVKQIVREAPRVGRNDPCPCGSGKKFKNCHGRNA